MSRPDHQIALRAEGRDHFAKAGLPSRKLEAWHYTDLSQSDVGGYSMAEPVASRHGQPGQIILSNGFLSAVGALPAGVTVEKLENATKGLDLVGQLLPVTDLPMVALNAHLFSDALILRVQAGAVIEQPIELVVEAVNDQTNKQFHGRLLVVLEAEAALTLIETHRGQGLYFSTMVMEVALKDGAQLRHITLQDGSDRATHVATVGIDLAKSAKYHGVVLHLGGHLVRHEIHALLSGTDADFTLGGASLVLNKQHIDNTTRIIHRAPRCTSRQLFKTVLDQEGHGVFQGTVLVERPGQKTSAHQLSRALMLSDRAAMDNKPELEIFADDVKCGHGATIGDIDENALFYMRGRGIAEPTARRMLTEAFLGEVLEQIDDQAIHDHLAALLQQRLGGLSQGEAA